MKTLKEEIFESVDYLKNKSKLTPKIGIILGTGLGSLVDEIEIETEIQYNQIPNFPVSTVVGHKGKLIFGKLSGKDVVVMQGRFHFYEGYSMQKVTFPIRVMKYLGVETLIVSNAVGAINLNFKKGDLVIISDHLNLTGTNPLIGPNDDELGERFTDMSEVYSNDLIKISEQVAKQNNIKLQKGVYVGLSGPSFETRAEINMLRLLGADQVGMSTVAEVIVAKHMSMNVLGFSIVTNECNPEVVEILKHEDVIATANLGTERLKTIVKGLIEKI